MNSRSADASGPTLGLLVGLVGRRRALGREGFPPTAEELSWLLLAATTVPDHGSLQPWRFVVVSGVTREHLAEALARDFLDARGDASEAVLERVRGKAYGAPTLIVLIASPDEASKVPVWEQLCSASCCGYAVVLAAQSLGLGAVWKSTPFRDGKAIQELFGLGRDEQLLGWVNVGGTEDDPGDLTRPAPDLSSLVTVLEPSGLSPYRPKGD
jgi:nitroreductase